MDELIQKFLKFMQLDDAQLEAFAQQVEAQQGPADPALIPTLAQQAGLPPQAIQFDPNFTPSRDAPWGINPRPESEAEFAATQPPPVQNTPFAPWPVGGPTSPAPISGQQAAGNAAQQSPLFNGMRLPGGHPNGLRQPTQSPVPPNVLAGMTPNQSPTISSGPFQMPHRALPPGLVAGDNPVGLPGGGPIAAPPTGDPATDAMMNYALQAMGEQAAAAAAREEAAKDRASSRAAPRVVGAASGAYTPMNVPIHALNALAQSGRR